MGAAVLKAIGLDGICHDFMYYVLNDSECKSTCGNCECSCLTNAVESGSEDSYEAELGLGDAYISINKNGRSEAPQRNES